MQRLLKQSMITGLRLFDLKWYLPLDRELKRGTYQAALRLAHLDRVSELLSRQVMEHHEVMVKGMNLVGELEKDLKVVNDIGLECWSMAVSIAARRGYCCWKSSLKSCCWNIFINLWKFCLVTWLGGWNANCFSWSLIRI